MIVAYDISCFERELQVVFPDGYEHLKEEVEKILDDAYCKWHSTEEIEDKDERAYVEDSCCEEFMIEVLSKTFNQWEGWISEYYGNEPEEIEDDNPCWTKNTEEV